MPKVNTVMICGDNRDRLTEQAIKSFFTTTDPELCDLTVALDAVEWNTVAMIRKWRPVYGFNVVSICPSLGAGFITNLGIAAATGSESTRGEFIYHTAADFYFRQGWLEGLLANWAIAERSGIGLLGAYSHPFHRSSYTIPGISGYTLHAKDMVGAGSWFMRRETWEEFGPLNTLHRGNYIGSEDTEFNFRLIKAGVGRATLVPEMVIHTGRTNAAGQPTLGAEHMPDISGVIIE